MSFILVFLITCVTLAVVMAALFTGVVLGTIRGRCSCGTAKQVLREFQSRERARLETPYDSAEVDPRRLPILDQPQ